MKLVTTVSDARREVAALVRPTGLVPTMGALHEGHLSLVSRARAECRSVAVSVFVNPLQFGPREDFDAYPRDLDADLRALRGAADVVFAPARDELVRPGALTTVHVGGLTEHLEGASRPGHFDGVATIVAKLLNVVAPDRAYFGEKDFQQLAVVRRMVADLDLGVTVVGCPVVRAPDGVALSSRNAYLDEREREHARALSRALFAAADSWGGDATWARAFLRRTLGAARGVRLDYAEVVDPETLEPLEGVTAGPAQALVAAWVGATRLIDTIRLEPREAA